MGTAASFAPRFTKARLISRRVHAEGVALLAETLRRSVDMMTSRARKLAEMRGMWIGLIGRRLCRDLGVAPVASGAYRHFGRLGRRRIAVAGSASEAGGGVPVNQMAMTAAGPGWRLGNGLQRKWDRDDDQRDRQQQFSRAPQQIREGSSSSSAKSRSLAPDFSPKYDMRIIAVLAAEPRYCAERRSIERGDADCAKHRVLAPANGTIPHRSAKTSTANAKVAVRPACRRRAWSFANAPWRQPDRSTR